MQAESVLPVVFFPCGERREFARGEEAMPFLRFIGCMGLLGLAVGVIITVFGTGLLLVPMLLCWVFGVRL
jgi:hypothetical protein